MLGQVEADGMITRVVISRGGPKLTHILFANDLVLFCWVSMEGCQSHYASAQGLRRGIGPET